MTICQVCEKQEAVGVASSTLGPISFAFCRRCLVMFSEPESMFKTVLEDTQGDVADWVKQVTTFVNGEYLTWDEWTKKQ